ncbi:MAG: efflux RND transporter periplasmic adaptor subunit [Nitrospirae bacterium]|nr:MAG: efflux RND transporter periplasmic adaptor subunit [Nitrospirota bacterium]
MTPKRTKWWLIAVGLAAVVAGLVFFTANRDGAVEGVARQGAKQAGSAPAGPIPEVAVMNVDRLYQIDPVPFKAAAVSAKAMVAQAEARLVQAKQNHDRVKPLLAEQAVSQKDVDDAVAEELAAKAALESAKGQLVKAQFDLDNTLIVAPISGLIERTRVYEGRLVSAQTDLLTIIHQVDPMYVTVSVPETVVLRRVRERAAKRVQGASVYELRGVITFVDGTTYPHEGKLDLLDVGLRTATGTRDVRVIFPNHERALLPGQFVKVRFLGAVRTGSILIPQRAVQQGPKGPVVYVVGEGDKVQARDVQASNWQGNQWLIEEGLHAGERVVVEGQQRIMPGAQVKPVPYDGVAKTSLNQGPGQGTEGADRRGLSGRQRGSDRRVSGAAHRSAASRYRQSPLLRLH